MITIFWDILCESAVFLLAGFAVAAVLDVVLAGRRFVRWLTAPRKRSVALAALVGVPLPLCSCSVLPTVLTLRRRGASRGATLSFLISTPETSVTSIFLTYALLGPVMAVVRPIAACVTALTAGLLENARVLRTATVPPADDTESKDAAAPVPDETGCDACPDDRTDAGDSSLSARLGRAFRYAFVDLFDDIFGWVIVGIAVAAAIQAWAPPEAMRQILGGPVRSMLLMIVIGVPIYVCAEASTPIAAVLIAGGLSPGAALVFLLVGPATNIGSLGVLTQHFGRATVVVYLASVVVVAVATGIGFDALLRDTGLSVAASPLREPLFPAWIKTVGAVLFLLLGIGTLYRRYGPGSGADRPAGAAGGSLRNNAAEFGTEQSDVFSASRTSSELRS